MAIYGYCRVSTERQAEEGESLGAQQRTIEGYAMIHGLKIDHVFVERGVSASKPLGERPEGAKLLAVLESGDAIITSKLDRMFRSALDALGILDRLKRKKVSLHMVDLQGDVTGNGIAKLFFTITSAFAEAERDRIRERICDVKADQKTRGRYLGGAVPFGWRLTEDGALTEDDVQQDAIRRMVGMRQRGASLRAIAADMQGEGFALSHAGVKKVITAALARQQHIKMAA